MQTTHQTAHGQLLDIATAPIGTVDLSRYTLPTYMRIVTFKTAFYSFYQPVACGLLVGGVAAPPAFALAKDICIQMGQYFQVNSLFVALAMHDTSCTICALYVSACSVFVGPACLVVLRCDAACVHTAAAARRSRTTTWTASATRR